MLLFYRLLNCGVPGATCKVVVGGAKARVAFMSPSDICATALMNALAKIRKFFDICKSFTKKSAVSRTFLSNSTYEGLSIGDKQAVVATVNGFGDKHYIREVERST